MRSIMKPSLLVSMVHFPNRQKDMSACDTSMPSANMIMILAHTTAYYYDKEQLITRFAIEHTITDTLRTQAGISYFDLERTKHNSGYDGMFNPVDLQFIMITFLIHSPMTGISPPNRIRKTPFF